MEEEYSLEDFEATSRYIIEIDDYIFFLLWKSVGDSGLNYQETARFLPTNYGGFIEDRNKITFISKNKLTNERNIYNCYTSVSELGLWRLCFNHPRNPAAVAKFDQYIQATVIDIRLQRFFYENYRNLDFVPLQYINSELYFNRFRIIRNESLINPNGAIPCKEYEQPEIDAINLRYNFL